MSDQIQLEFMEGYSYQIIDEKTWEIVFLFAAAFSILAVLLICLFLFANGIPAMHKIGWLDFLFGKTWKPGNEQEEILDIRLKDGLVQSAI